MSRIYFPSDPAGAQAFCDKVHTQMIADEPVYAKSVASGQTVRWDSPRQDLDDAGKPISDIYVIVKDRVVETLSPAEISKVSAFDTTVTKEL